MDFLIGIIQTYGSIAATLKHCLRKITIIDILAKESQIINYTLTLILLITSIIPFILVSIILIIFFVYKSFVTLILKIRFGTNFVGTLQSADALWMFEDHCYNIVNILIIIDVNDPKQTLFDFAKNCLMKLIRSPRLCSVRKFFMGYGYFLHDDSIVEHLITSVRINENSDECNEKDLRKFAGKLCNRELPINNKSCMELVVCEDKLKFEGREDENLKCVIFRYHHSAGDGITFISLLTRLLTDDKTTIIRETLAKSESQKIKFSDYFLYTLNKFFKCYSYISTIFDSKDKNPFVTSKLSNEKNVAFKIEKNRGVLVKKIREIKNAYKSTFSSVLYAAVSASLCDHLKGDRKNTVPMDFTLTFMAVPEMLNFHYSHTELRNVMSVGNVRIPLEDVPIAKLLAKITEESKKYINSCDNWIYYYQFKLFATFFPRPFMKGLVETSAISTVGFTNVPGINAVTIGGYKLVNLLGMVPNFITIGICFTVCTYDDKLQMGVLIDKNVIPNEEDVKKILDNVYTNIDKLYDTITPTNSALIQL